MDNLVTAPNCDVGEESSSSNDEKKLERNETETDPPRRSSRAANLRSQMTSKSVSDEEASASDAASEEMETNETGADAPGSSKADVKRYKCPQCPKRYVNKSTMTAHTRIHDEDKLYKCEVCQIKVFATLHGYKRHMLTHTGEKTHECSTCHRWFGLPSHLERHRYTHLDEKFYCSECPDQRFFRSPDQLSAHMIFHKKKKRHECTICHKEFHLSSSLKRHQRVHTKERPFECDMCKKRFSLAGHLKTHIQRHIGDKPHKCGVCEKGFTTNCNLQQHIKNCAARMDKRKYTCQVCPRRYSAQRSLNAHMKMHSDETMQSI